MDKLNIDIGTLVKIKLSSSRELFHESFWVEVKKLPKTNSVKFVGLTLYGVPALDIKPFDMIDFVIDDIEYVHTNGSIHHKKFLKTNPLKTWDNLHYV